MCVSVVVCTYMKSYVYVYRHLLINFDKYLIQLYTTFKAINH